MTTSERELQSLLLGLRHAIGGRLHAARNHRSLAGVAGNFAIIVRGVSAWTIVTDGPRRGLYEELTDDPVGFALICAPEVLPRVFATEECDVSADLEAENLILHGDVEIFERFMALPAVDTTLSLRLSA